MREQLSDVLAEVESLPGQTEPIRDQLEQGWELIPEAYRPWILPGLAVLVGLVILRSLWRRIARLLRRRRPSNIHPSLQKYNVDHAALDRERQTLAQRIEATSTTGQLVGFRLVRQVDAVFVEGFRSPTEAMTGLKAAAVERGANGLLNVHTERTSAGRCTASGDAVVIEPGPGHPPAPRASGMPSETPSTPPNSGNASMPRHSEDDSLDELA